MVVRAFVKRSPIFLIIVSLPIPLRMRFVIAACDFSIDLVERVLDATT